MAHPNVVLEPEGFTFLEHFDSVDGSCICSCSDCQLEDECICPECAGECGCTHEPSE